MPVAAIGVHDWPAAQSAAVPHTTSPEQVAEQVEPVAERQHWEPATDVQPFAPPQVNSGAAAQPPATHWVPVMSPTPVRVSQQDDPDAQSSAASHANFTSAALQVFEHCSDLAVLS